MAQERKEAFQNLIQFPRTEQQIKAVPELLKQMFYPHLAFIREANQFWADGQNKAAKLAIGSGVIHAAKRMGNKFSFYSELEDRNQRKTTDISLDRSFGRIERVEIIWQVSEGESADQPRKIFTDINLQDGFRLEQDADQIPLLVPSFSPRQLFVMDPSLNELASLVWMIGIGNNDYPIFTISPNSQKFIQPLIRDIKSGRFFFEVAGMTIPYSFPSADEFLSQAIRDVLDLKPVHFSP